MKSYDVDLRSVWDAVLSDSPASYDAFGNPIDVEHSHADLDIMLGYSGCDLEDDEKLQPWSSRCHDPTPGKWLNIDPVEFEADDANLYRYVGTKKDS
ncbi:MAG: hypothetical protein H8E66_16425 [Planctomycetes bacterium]|nr:hypothetical protein [Planctomycetota bacterium]